MLARWGERMGGVSPVIGLNPTRPRLVGLRGARRADTKRPQESVAVSPRRILVSRWNSIFGATSAGMVVAPTRKPGATIAP